jgi:hypothetical protein
VNYRRKEYIRRELRALLSTMTREDVLALISVTPRQRRILAHYPDGPRTLAYRDDMLTVLETLDE